MTQDIIIAALVINAVATLYLSVKNIHANDDIKKLRRDVDQCGSSWKVETIDARSWKMEARFEALIRYMNLTVEKPESKWEVK